MKDKRKKNRRRTWDSGKPLKGTIRLRAKPLDKVDDEKLTLAYWMLAKKIVEDRSDAEELTRENVTKLAESLDDDSDDRDTGDQQ